jgi:hypothetical protein
MSLVTREQNARETQKFGSIQYGYSSERAEYSVGYKRNLTVIIRVCHQNKCVQLLFTFSRACMVHFIIFFINFSLLKCFHDRSIKYIFVRMLLIDVVYSA